jgi:hypothetical protein
MNLRAGIIGSSPGWEELLSQAGVPVLTPVPLDSPRTAFSALIAARRLEKDEIVFVREYLRGGGAILGSTASLQGLVGPPGDPARLSYLVPEGGGPIPGLSLIDVERTGEIPREANCLRTSENVHAVFAGELHGGLAVVTPFDPGEAMEDFRAVERYFYARPERLPSERVSRVSKNEIRHFVRQALEYLHHARGIPFASLLPFPAGATNVFAFRIDSDNGTRAEIDELYRISAESNVPFTWFLDAGSHRTWLGRFSTMERQEIGLHCFEHRIFLDAARDEENIRRGLGAMKESGLSPSSFAAPFGFWSPDMGRAIDRFGFSYSSEFAWAYDSLPHYPVSGTGRYATMQVPVHPIAIGSLRKSGFTPARMLQYFRDVVAGKLSRREPLIFYHHPGHRQWDLVRKLCDHILNTGARPLMMGQYAAWWRARRALRPVFRLEGDTVVASTDGPLPGGGVCDVTACISRKGGEETLIPLPGVDSGAGGRPVHYYVPPADITRTREFDLRGEIGRQFTRLQRRFP